MSGLNDTISYECPKCKTANVPKGKALTVRAHVSKLRNLFCPHSSITDKFKEPKEPAIPIGSRGVIDGKTYEVLGYLLKKDKRYKYRWSEYFLFNPNHGIAFLSEYGGNWNFLTPYANHDWLLNRSSFRIQKRLAEHSSFIRSTTHRYCLRKVNSSTISSR
ncbi:MAG: DUF4178 domain-containing protein [Bacteroidota bacterium]